MRRYGSAGRRNVAGTRHGVGRPRTRSTTGTPKGGGSGTSDNPALTGRGRRSRDRDPVRARRQLTARLRRYPTKWVGEANTPRCTAGTPPTVRREAHLVRALVLARGHGELEEELRAASLSATRGRTGHRTHGNNSGDTQARTQRRHLLGHAQAPTVRPTRSARRWPRKPLRALGGASGNSSGPWTQVRSQRRHQLGRGLGIGLYDARPTGEVSRTRFEPGSFTRPRPATGRDTGTRVADYGSTAAGEGPPPCPWPRSS